MTKPKKFSQKISAVILLLLPIVLIILPVNYFDTGESVCLSHVVFDTSCYGCGMTKAIMHLVHFDFESAIIYNRLSFVVLPLLILLWIKILLKQFDVEFLKWF
ncbi:MAG: DUF2752 domain-containing protein [Bacteroidota bacterium]